MNCKAGFQSHVVCGCNAPNPAAKAQSGPERLRQHAQDTVAADGAPETFTAAQMQLIETAIRQAVFETWGTILTDGGCVLARAAIGVVRGVGV